MTDHQQPCAPLALPEPLGQLVGETCWVRDTMGEAGGAVYRLTGGAAGDHFLKHGTGRVADDITDEMTRLCWLAGQVPVPRVAGFVRVADDAWLLTRALPGRTAGQVLDEEPAAQGAVVDALAAFLRRLHALPVDACPFNADAGVRMAQARRRIDAGLVDADDFDDARAGWSAGAVWDAARALLPLAPDRVVTHGDFSIDNVLISNGQVTGCIDVGRLWVADRYQDLAILWNRLGDHDPALQARLWAGYGIDAPDSARLHFHLLLDELF